VADWPGEKSISGDGRTALLTCVLGSVELRADLIPPNFKALSGTPTDEKVSIIDVAWPIDCPG